MNMPYFDIWREGYLFEGDTSTAQHMGGAHAPNFTQACIEVLIDDPAFNLRGLTWWGCKLFADEDDARERFG